MQKLQAISQSGSATFKIVHHDLRDSLAVLLIRKPEDFFAAMKVAITSYWRNKGEVEFAKWLEYHLDIEITDIPAVSRLDRDALDKFVALGPCQVHRIEPLRTVKIRTAYRCQNASCNRLIEVYVGADGKLEKPAQCPACEKKQLKEEGGHIQLQDQRYIEVVMVNEAGLATEKALKYWLDVRGEKAFNVPDFGETWIVSGIVRLSEDKDAGPISERVTHFLYLEANAIQKVVAAQGGRQQQIEVTPDLLAARRRWVSKCVKEGKDPEAELVKLMLPKIVGEDLLKLSLLRQAASGAVENVGERTEINILVMRNPGRAKTDLATFMAAATGGAYIPAEGASEVGLTVGLETDERTKKKAARAGVAVLNNRKNIYMDEVDKLKKKYEVLPSLNTCLDKGFYIETKIFSKTFETRSPWAMFGNFKHKTYDPDKSLWWNIDLPSDTMDRFDLWHIDPSSTYDAATMEAILNAQSDSFESGKREIEVDEDLKAHIACAKSIREIKFEPGVREIFKDFFRDMKKLEAHMGGLRITNRMFNGLWRQAIARAVLHLRDTVTKQDAEAAIHHLTEVLGKIGVDPSTGEVNIERLQGGDPKKRSQRMSMFKSIMAQAQGSRTEDVSEESLIQIIRMGTQYKTPEQAKELINEAFENHIIRQTKPGWWILNK